MLTKLNAEQISKFWNEIKEHLEVGLVPYVAVTPDGMTFILESLLNDSMQCWVLRREGEESIFALATTSIIVEPASQTKNLVIYSLSGYQVIPRELYQEGMKVLHEYARTKGCKLILAYTSVLAVERLALQLGATRAALLSWRI